MAQSIDIQSILQASPEGSINKGSETVGKFILEEGLKLANRTQPILDKLKEELGISGDTLPDLCPALEALDAALQKRNAIVTDLQSISTKLDRLAGLITQGATFLDITSTTLGIIKTSKTLAAAAVAPLPVVPGAVTSTLNTLEDLINTILYTNTGTPRIPIIKSGLNFAYIATSIVNKYIQNIITALLSIDSLLTRCNSSVELEEIPTSFTQAANIQLPAEDTSYKGFFLEIEEVPFSTTVTRKRAIAKNSQGIVMAQTDLSFTTIPQILIEQLKFIIDSQNLKPF